MNNSAQKVMDTLRQKRTQGVTHWDFPNGFALRSRIADLRRLGHKIITNMESNTNNTGRHARYFLIKMARR